MKVYRRAVGEDPTWNVLFAIAAVVTSAPQKKRIRPASLTSGLVESHHKRSPTIAMRSGMYAMTIMSQGSAM